MRQTNPFHLLMLLLLLAAGSGCGRRSEAPPPLAEEQIPSTLEGAFASAPEDIRKMTLEAISLMQGGDFGSAFLQLQQLTGRPELTPEQREFAGQAMLTAGEKAREAAARGDARATEAMQIYSTQK